MEEVLKACLSEVAAGISPDVEVELSIPDSRFGDYSTNLALKLAAINNQSPRTLAENLLKSLNTKLADKVRDISIAGPGFINFRLSDRALINEISNEPKRFLEGQVAVVEYSDPNVLKTLHAGHLYTSIVGESIANLMNEVGAKVYRINYVSDVGLHVAKSIWQITHLFGAENPDRLENIAEDQRAEWMSAAYVQGNKAYDSDEVARAEITELNQKIYAILKDNDHNAPLAQIYWVTRGWSFTEFDRLYSRLHIMFDRYYTESEVARIGLEKVKEQLSRGVFEMSDGAVVFRGEKYGLHTRVFINSVGLPTYEAKDIGLAELKKRDFNYDRSVIITASEQEQYFAVVLKALEQFEPEQAKHTVHLSHGMVRLSGGKKMSSRLGNILRAQDVLNAASEAAAKVGGKVDEQVMLAAVKYSLLKQRLGGDIVYEPEESVNVLGNSGPYLQYAHARARSILTKSSSAVNFTGELTDQERELARGLSRYASVVEVAAKELSPHLLCSYLYDLSQIFNRFYEANRVIGDPREQIRLGLIQIYANRLKSGLNILGIDAPDHL
ncbi:arginine--tRNA ligase [Patescibacteria group bacterium]|nr:arginine--tRNA ligase [Patescibacteria group bacterium]